MKLVLEKLETLLAQSDPAAPHLPLLRMELEWMIAELRRTLNPGAPNTLRMARADKNKDVRHLKSEDILLEVLQMVREVPEDRDTRMVICWHTYAKAEPDGAVSAYRRCAGMTNSRMIATLFAEAAEIAHAWSGP
jgi:hypothetical protein